MESERTHVMLAAEDFYRVMKNALDRNAELEKELKDAEKNNKYVQFRNIMQQINANKEFRWKITGDLYEKLEKIFNPSSSSES